MWEEETRQATQATISEIIESAVTKRSIGPERPLPLVSSWHYGYHDRMGPGNWAFNPSPTVFKEGWFSPGFQMRLIREGHHVLPTLVFPGGPKSPENNGTEEQWETYEPYYKPALEEYKKNGLPFSLISSQWEKILSEDSRYTSLPPDKNPNVITPTGENLDKLDPFAPTENWYEAGKETTSGLYLKKLQEIYPNPPRIIFVSNNEHRLLLWKDIEQSQRYLEKYGKGKFDDFKRHAIAQAWKEKYRALQRGMRDGFTSDQWKKNSIFIGYASAAPFAPMGKWPSWANYSLHSNGDLVPQAEMWDGAAPSYYLPPFRAITDYTVESPQIESMNLVEPLREIYKINPGFWFELSYWDGATPPPGKGWSDSYPPSKPAQFREMGQEWDANRFRGFVQYGLWLLRPRVLREYRSEYRTQSLAEMEAEFSSIAFAVDCIYKSEILKDFWRNGVLVSNPDGEHPYQSALPKPIRDWPRWFLLDVDVNPKPPYLLTTNIPVFALALKKGEKPEREWLIYAHSPLGNRSGVGVTIPDYGKVKMDTNTAGSFLLVKEKTKTTLPLDLK